jgi:hypothetical protein
LAIAGLGAGAFAAVLMLTGSPFDLRGQVDVPYPAGEVKELRVLGAFDMYVDGEPKLGASIFGSIALFMLATASFVTFGALRFAAAPKRTRWFWLIAAAGLAVAAADELLAIHESVGHNLPFLADLPGVKRPDDVLLLLYLPAALLFVWSFRDVIRAHRLTSACMIAALGCFAASAASDLVSLRIEEWFELAAGLFIAAGLIALMHRHLKTNLQVRATAMPSIGVRDQRAEARPQAEPALRR